MLDAGAQAEVSSGSPPGRSSVGEWSAGERRPDIPRHDPPQLGAPPPLRPPGDPPPDEFQPPPPPAVLIVNVAWSLVTLPMTLETTTV